ncbi:MAG TPA: hypothetical protein VGE76_19360, partial [Opitutaceae bacterium]
KVDGEYQGAAFRFLEGLQSGPIRLEFLPDGSLLCGETNRGWNSAGTRSYGLERIRWSGTTPFEILSMRVRPDGWVLEFTHPIDAATAKRKESYAGTSYTYTYQRKYGSLEIDPQPVVVTAAEVLPDGKSVRLRCTGMRKGFVHRLATPGIRSRDGTPVANPVAHYTLNRLPSAGSR